MKVFPTTAARRVLAVGAAAMAGLAISTAAYAATSSPAAARTPAAAIPKCTASDLGVWLAIDQGNGAAGTIYFPLEFTNLSGHTCSMYGFPGVSAISRGGQQLGATHSQNIELFYAFVPGMKVVAPSSPADAKALLLAAIRDDDPVLFLENLALYNTKGEVPDDDTPAEIGRAAVTRPGKDLTLIGYSRMAHVAAEVAASLAETDGLDIEVVDLRSLRPLDRETIVASVRKTHAAVVLEDDWLTYGIGAEVAASISDGAFDYLDAPVRRVAMAEVPMPYSKTLETAALPSRDDVTAAIRQTLAAVGHRTAPLALGVPQS